MIKEPKNIDFYTTGRQPSAQEFIRISEWIKKDKKRKETQKTSKQPVKKRTSPNCVFTKLRAEGSEISILSLIIFSYRLTSSNKYFRKFMF